MLFGQLDADIFTLFSGSNRHLYELVLVKVYEDFFRSDLYFPAQSEVVALIYDRLGHHADLWREDEAPVVLDQVVTRRGRRMKRRGIEAADAQATNEAMIRARHIYSRLIATGWLEEARYGLKVTVDMPPGAMRLAEFLCTLREGMSEQLGGLVVQIKNQLDALQVNARDNALGLHKAARDAASFGRYLRSVLSTLREIDKQVLASDSVEQRLRHYFEDFVERVLLQDYAAISTTSHPYRYRHRIFASLDAIDDSIADVAALADAYVEARLAGDVADARDMIFDDLAKIRRVFERIEEAFVRIQQHRTRLETRLRNTVRYAGRRSGSFLQRSEPILLRLDRLQAGIAQTALPNADAPDPDQRNSDLSGFDLADFDLAGPIETRVSLLSPFLLARPRNARPPIAGGFLVLAPPDPLRELRKRLEREYLERLAVTPEQVGRFLENRVPPSGETHASRLRLESIDDFLAFEALRLAVAGSGDSAEDVHPLIAHLRTTFAFTRSDDAPVDNDWLRCTGFSIARKTDRTMREIHHAG